MSLGLSFRLGAVGSFGVGLVLAAHDSMNWECNILIPGICCVVSDFGRLDKFIAKGFSFRFE